MSRIGKMPVVIPEKVKITIKERTILVEGPLGKLEYIIPNQVDCKVEKNQIILTSKSPSRSDRSLQGLARALVNNMVEGVSKGFTKELEINGVGYRAELKGKDINLSLGFSHPVLVPIPDGIKVAIDKQTKLAITGFNKQLVGQFTADIRALKKPEPFKGKGIKYASEHIRRKAGKSAAGSKS